MRNYRAFNRDTNTRTLEEKHGRSLNIRTLKAQTEEERKQWQSIDIYNGLLHRIKHEETKHPEQLIMAKVLKDRGETELLYSLVVNA